jgi:hypothetical protein
LTYSRCLVITLFLAAPPSPVPSAAGVIETNRLQTDSDGLNHVGRQRSVIAVTSAFVDGHDDIHARSYLAKHWMLTRGGFIEKVQKGVVDGIQEKLGSSTVGFTGISHG